MIEPCLLGEYIPEATSDLISLLIEKSAKMEAHLHPRTAQSLAAIVRVMNCYYSNLIEGHDTKLQDIERALNDDFSDNEENRNLQIEAKAHIRVQEKIDSLYALNQLPSPTSVEFIEWLHKEFYKGASLEMLTIKSNSRVLKLTPGKFRESEEHNVTVGLHNPPTGENVSEFMRYFEQRYSKLGRTNQIIAIAAAHHRLAYIHPFLDGNGRVCRLMSHAMSLNAGIGVHGLWSISRGLARGLEGSGEYKRKMSLADSPRKGDLDGRGNLSLSELIYFTNWFLNLCLDQMDFMSKLFDMGNLKNRLEHYISLRELKPEAFRILKAVLIEGEIARGEAEYLTGFKERQARTILSSLTHDGILGSDSPKGSVSLRFSVDSARILFPKLFE
jgi:Fic family protein